ncbi:ATP-binding protein [Amycolatopsis granulosa]|uniref:ATP-binding protein n=1 Tax=Amycolatopsis granulosa TaxID=185684 RepID=UPI001422898A|nr:ATP-binding protein [Amycolatopsis granulosa]NIH83325.1 hypothetical protein [Amycolatopsis granulosa]
MRHDEEIATGGDGVSLWLPPDERPPPLVRLRRWAAEALADLGEDHLVATQLVATELVTNAYEHGGGPARVRVRREREPCRIRIEVSDRSSTPPVAKDPDDTVVGGRGLRMVDKVSLDWGSHPSDGGKTVWALVDCAAYGWQPCSALEQPGRGR